MDKRYYTPSIEEFHVGFRYEALAIKGGSDWMKMIIPINHESPENWERVFMAPDTIRVQHLHSDDFKELGIKCERVPRQLGKRGDGYICSAKINHPREKSPVNLKIYFTPQTNWTMITVKEQVLFAGTTMNISELRSTLKRIQADAIIKE